MKLEEMISLVEKHSGWTIARWQITSEQIEQVRSATGTAVEYNEGGSPRFMPADKDDAELIRAYWRRCGIDVIDYGKRSTSTCVNILHSENAEKG